VKKSLVGGGRVFFGNWLREEGSTRKRGRLEGRAGGRDFPRGSLVWRKKRATSRLDHRKRISLEDGE